jgi:hypothetical protein
VMVPAVGVSAHLTPVPEGRFRTENCLVPAGATVAVAGLTLVGSTVKVTVAVPRVLYVTGFVAIGVTARIVTVCWDETMLGAV